MKKYHILLAISLASAAMVVSSILLIDELDNLIASVFIAALGIACSLLYMVLYMEAKYSYEISKQEQDELYR